MLSTKTIAYLLAYITCSLSILTACSTPQIDTSPRGIGEPQVDQKVTGETLKKYPHLSWDEQKRTIGERTISYAYGQGNPEEVALEQDEITKQFGTHQNNTTSDTHYVTPEAESILLQILSYPQLDRAMSVCGRYFVTRSHPYWRDDMISQYIDPARLDINDFLVINPETHRKQTNLPLLHNTLNQMFRQDRIVIVSDCLEEQKMWDDLQGMIPLYNQLIDEVRADPVEKLVDGWNPIIK